MVCAASISTFTLFPHSSSCPPSLLFWPGPHKERMDFLDSLWCPCLTPAPPDTLWPALPAPLEGISRSCETFSPSNALNAPKGPLSRGWKRNRGCHPLPARRRSRNPLPEMLDSFTAESADALMAGAGGAVYYAAGAAPTAMAGSLTPAGATYVQGPPQAAWPAQYYAPGASLGKQYRDHLPLATATLPLQQPLGHHHLRRSGNTAGQNAP